MTRRSREVRVGVDRPFEPDAKALEHQAAPPRAALARSPQRSTWRTLLSCAGLGLAALLWLAALPLDPDLMDDFGLLSILPLQFYLSLAVLTLSFALTLATPHVGRRLEGWLLGSHLVLFILIVHGTPALVYDTLRYSWAWKHVGIVDYILRYGTVNRTIDTLNVYHNWPGFFASVALFFRTAGFDNALSVARVAAWAPVFFNLLNLGALYVLFQELAHSPRRVWLALWFVLITSWVGQDYFSPQAFALFFHLIALGVAARWFALRSAPSVPHRADAVPNAAAPSTAAPSTVAPKTTVGATLLLLVGLFIVIATSHQLTPMFTVLSLGALVLFTRNRALGLPALMAVITATWVVYGATPFFRVEVAELVGSFGQLSENIEGTLINLSEISPAQRLVSLAGRALTLCVWGLAFLGVARHVYRWRTRSDWGLIALAGAPFLLLVGNAYGGEVLFRVYLFALPFMGLWVASLFFAGDEPPTSRTLSQPMSQPMSWWRGAAIVLLSALLLSGFTVAYYGKEQQYYFSPDEVEAAQAMYRAAPAGSLIVEGSPNYPSRFTHYENYIHVALTREPLASRKRILAQPALEMKRWMSGDVYTDAYLILTRGQRADVDALGELPPGSLGRIERVLRDSPDFEVFFENEDAVIFTLSPLAAGAQP